MLRWLLQQPTNDAPVARIFYARKSKQATKNMLTYNTLHVYSCILADAISTFYFLFSRSGHALYIVLVSRSISRKDSVNFAQDDARNTSEREETHAKESGPQVSIFTTHLCSHLTVWVPFVSVLASSNIGIIINTSY